MDFVDEESKWESEVEELWCWPTARPFTAGRIKLLRQPRANHAE